MFQSGAYLNNEDLDTSANASIEDLEVTTIAKNNVGVDTSYIPLSK